MSARVAFVPRGQGSTVPLALLGESPDGSWGTIDDRVWLDGEAGIAVELLYLSPADYRHAVRGLSGDQIGEAVQHRMRVFTAELAAHALGEVTRATLRCLVRWPLAQASGPSLSDALVALASFTTVSRLAHTAPLVVVDYLREGDAGLIAELDSPSLGAAGRFDADGREREFRRRLALELGSIAAVRGRQGEDQLLPYVDVTRVYLVQPGDAALERQARLMGEPVHPWKDGIILPVPERLVPDIETGGRKATLLFPAMGTFLAAVHDCSPAQLEVVLAERQADPGFAAHLDERRVQQAVLRSAAQLAVGSDAPLASVLNAHHELEVSRLAAWLSSAPEHRMSLAALAAELRGIVETAELLAHLSVLAARPKVSGKVLAFARALGHVAEEARG